MKWYAIFKTISRVPLYAWVGLGALVKIIFTYGKKIMDAYQLWKSFQEAGGVPPERPVPVGEPDSEGYVQVRPKPIPHDTVKPIGTKPVIIVEGSGEGTLENTNKPTGERPTGDIINEIDEVLK